MRIVSLTCSNTEIVCALGCADDLVAVDDHSDYPPRVVADLPRVGPDLGIDIGKVAALEPDLVLASLTVPGHEKIVEGLQQAGLPFLAPEPVSLADVYDDIRTIADALGVSDRGQSLIDEMRGSLQPRELGGRRPSLAVQWWPKPVILPGRRSWVHDLIELAGGRNLLGDEDVKSRPVTDDEVRQLAPDAIILSWCGVEEEKYRPDVVLNNSTWQDLPAIRDQHVYSITEAFLGRPSPRLIDGYQALARIVDQLA